MDTLRKGWTPERIEGRLKVEWPADPRMRISHECLHRWIHAKPQRALDLRQYLPRGKRHRTRSKGRRARGPRIPMRVPITDRPKKVDSRHEFGHFESDTVVGASPSKRCIDTQVERKSRRLFARLIPDKGAPATARAEYDIHKDIPAPARIDRTWDNGTESSCHLLVDEALGMLTYYAAPYSSHQRGTNENRNLAIESHKPTPFWRLVVPMDGWTLESGKIEDQAMARRILANAMGLPVEVLEVRRRREHAKPPTLFDLTGLQKAMSDRHGLTVEQTLDCLQHLYEMKVATYPRTDSKYITHDDVDGLKELLQPKYALGFLDQKPVEAIHDLYSAGGFDPMRCVADDKVQGHTAILPTRRLTYDVFQHDLTDMEREVIAVILTRMWSACATDRVHDTVKVDAVLDERHADGSMERVPLSASSDVTVEAGWTAIEGISRTDDAEKKPVNRMPDSLGKGPLPQSGTPSLTEGVSAPPKPFTEATLRSAMEHAGRFVADSDLKAALDDDTSHSGGIGTPATRAGILESLVKSGYLQRKGKQLRSTPAGRMLVGVAIDELKDVKLTAQWEQSLADIEHGKGRRDGLSERDSHGLRGDARAGHGNDPAGQSAAIGPAGRRT